MFRWFEQRLNPFKPSPGTEPPDRLGAFYWHFLRQVWPNVAAILVTGFFAALVEVALFAYLGQIVDMVREASNASDLFADHWRTLVWMSFVAVIARPILFALHTILVNQAVVPGFTNMIRWQTHRHVLRQSLSFFQNDFAGRIANRIMQTGPALRESVVQSVDALWFMVIYTVMAGVIFFDNDPLLMLPLAVWVVALTAAMVYFVPRIKDRSAIISEARSSLMGRIVDSYTNIPTLKLFAHTDREDDYARESITDHTRKFHDQQRLITLMEIVVWTINGALIVATIGLALWLWSRGLITIGAIALTAGLVIRINNMAGWVMFIVTSIFENIGIVQEGMETISKPHGLVDAPAARPLKVSRGEIRFEHVRFGYGLERGIVDDLSLTIHPGEKVGVVGRSGAGKSTLVNLLLRFYDLESGRILIDDQDISRVTQDSLRAQIGMVTQDTSLLHRSIMENILYGRPDAGEDAAIAAAKRAHAHDFVGDMADPEGRWGYAARVGERGVKLSGGQRQRVAIARVLLKDAPILILDEATSALDSEVEAAIQEQLYNLMRGKTVIAIAHRLSTISAMDRLVVMDQGQIVEQGAHQALIEANGIYAQLWARQSGGFLAETAAA
jgi:ATP-binding cassette subfamily B multidrug efflux pump